MAGRVSGPAGAKFIKTNSSCNLLLQSISRFPDQRTTRPQTSLHVISVDDDIFYCDIAMAEYRNLAPSTQNEYSSASSTYNTSGGLGTPNTQGTSSGGTGGSNNGSGSGAGSGSGSGGGDGQQRRRRAAGQVSVLACTECRRARAKVSDIRSTVMSLWARNSHFRGRLSLVY